MAIHKLPNHLINRLKAGEVVEKPAAIIKELIENSLDAKANKIKVNIVDGGKKIIQVEDNGEGIELSDMELVLERHATSKIKDEEDLYNIQHYGFRGEALASIAEVSKITITTKTKYAQIGTKLSKIGSEIVMKHLPVAFNHGTNILIEDLFYNVPARLKFLKSPQTEYYYCYNYFVDFALKHWDKYFILQKNNNNIFDLKPVENILKRINDIFKKDYSSNLKEIHYQNNYLKLNGYISNPQLRFGSGENIRIYVNQRPISDKVIRKAINDAYKRQIHPGEYPFILIDIDIDPHNIDVNVHPRKTEIKFSNAKDIYQIIYNTITDALGTAQITKIDHNDIRTITPDSIKSKFTSNYNTKTNLFNKTFTNNHQNLSHTNTINTHNPAIQETQYENSLGEYQILGQLRNSYIILQSNDSLYYIDQHALAERISFEKMKKDISEKDNLLKPDILLQPISIQITKKANIESIIDDLNKLGFDIALISDNQLAIYAVPQIFNIYKIDLELLFNHILYLDNISFDFILDRIFATKACKTSIKAGQKLSHEQIQNLIKDGFQHINGLFVCQHGRPFFIQIEKKQIDKLFDR